jgi:RNA polymerase-binding transcription factor DksA
MSPRTSTTVEASSKSGTTTTGTASGKSSAKAKNAQIKAAASGKATTTKQASNDVTGTTMSAPTVLKPVGAAVFVKDTNAAARSNKPMLPVPPKKGLKYPEADLKFFRSNIERAREEALEELRMLRERLEDLTNSENNEDSSIYSMHMAEQGSEAVEKEKTYAQIQRIQDYIRKLEEAIARIDDKTYGICRMCGILIAKERLIAVPITTLSASYKIRQRCPEDGIDRIVAKSPDALK